MPLLLSWLFVLSACDARGSCEAQVIARIHTSGTVVRRLIHSLLICIGRHHPQALMYPLLVACKSQSSFRRAAAMSVVDNVRSHSPTLVEQAQLVGPLCTSWLTPSVSVLCPGPPALSAARAA